MNKKWIVLIVVVVLIVGVAAYLVGKGTFSGGEKSLTNYTEGTTKYLGLSKSVVIKYDVLAGEVELGYKIDQKYLDLGMLSIDISLLNKSQHLIKQTEADLRITDAQGKTVLQKYILFIDLKPGETAVERGFSMVDLNRLDSEPKKITITLWKLWGETTVSPTPTPTPPATISPTKVSPGSVVKAFWTAIQKGQYIEAKEYLVANSEMLNPEMIKQIEEYFKTNPGKAIQKVEIIQESIDGASARVRYVVYSRDGTKDEDEGSLRKENGTWKLKY